MRQRSCLLPLASCLLPLASCLLPLASCLLPLASCLLPLALTGCSLSPTSTPEPQPGAPINGIVHGGQQPFVTSHVYLMAANTTGYGGDGIAASGNNASVSLLNVSSMKLSDAVGAYVLTGSDGSFSITGDYTCTPNSQVYLYVYGGRPAGPNILANSAAGFLAILGNCPSNGTFATSVPVVNVNEVTTVAAAFAFSGFATDALHVSSSGTSLAQTGIANAFANAANLASVSTGTALSTTPAGNGVVPQATINTLANILASCVNSNDDTGNPSGNPRLFSAACLALVSLATADGTSTGTQPGDTATAAINIAHHPGSNVAALFGTAAGLSAPFQPTLSEPPTDYTLGISFSSDLYSFNSGGNIALDASGNIWFAEDYDYSLVKMSGLGILSEYTSVAIGETLSVAVDKSANIWTVASPGTLGEVSSSGSAISPFNGYSIGTSSPHTVAVDGLGSIWTSDRSNASNAASLSKTSSSHTLLSPAAGYTGGGLTQAGPIAIDGSGSVWVGQGSSLSKFSNSGTGLSPSTGFTGGGLSSFRIAIDSAGNVWAANSASLSKFSNSGSAITTSGGYTGGGLSDPDSIAIDGSGNVWVANDNSKAYSVSEFNSSGIAITPSTGYASALFGLYLSPNNIAVDGSGNVWVSCGVSSSGPVPFNPTMLELIGASTPVITPIAAGLPSTFTSDGTSNLGTRP